MGAMAHDNLAIRMAPGGQGELPLREGSGGQVQTAWLDRVSHKFAFDMGERSPQVRCDVHSRLVGVAEGTCVRQCEMAHSTYERVALGGSESAWTVGAVHAFFLGLSCLGYST